MSFKSQGDQAWKETGCLGAYAKHARCKGDY